MEVTFPGGVGWLDTGNRAISVQLNLTGTATGTELGKMFAPQGKVWLTVEKLRVCHYNQNNRHTCSDFKTLRYKIKEVGW